MGDVHVRRKLKVLSQDAPPGGHIDLHALASLISETGCVDAHVHRLTELLTPDFEWPFIVNVGLPSADDRGATLDVVPLKGRLLEWSAQFLQTTRLRFVNVTELGFGDERNGAHLVTSYYRWRPDISEHARTCIMREHLEMEREQRLYEAVHFSTVGEDPFEDASLFDFFFEGYLKDRESIEMLYRDPWVARMRDHSKSFLDTDSRRLAFGRVEIVRPPDALRLHGADAPGAIGVD